MGRVRRLDVKTAVETGQVNGRSEGDFSAVERDEARLDRGDEEGRIDRPRDRRGVEKQWTGARSLLVSHR